MKILSKIRCFDNILKINHLLKFRKCFLSMNQTIVETKPKRELSSKYIRNSFIDYFVSKQNHTFIKSSPVLPENDETLLFVSAGMNQFKDIFQNKLSPNDSRNGFIRCVNSQKCIRVGGKHCDLSSVGTDNRHHTFFEMLGNWSFGDYYKEESCHMAWDLLTKVFRLDENRLIVTYFGGDKQLGLGPDFETKEIWLKMGLPEYRVIPLGANDNFWEMGETGPCGICTEIHYLLEPTSSTDSNILLNKSLEIWNIVFMEFDRKINGKLDNLHKHFVDTGMGLERIASVVQNVKSNYETDLFVPYFKVIERMSNCRSYSSSDDTLDISYRILADHSRMFTIAISDGLLPSYRGTGFILRKIIRKSIGIAANDFGVSNPKSLFSEMIEITRELLAEAFPELNTNSKRVNEVIEDEILKYESVVTGNRRLLKAFKRIDLKYSIHLNEEIHKKLEEIKNQIKYKLKDNSIDKEFIETNKNYLFSVKDIASDYTINLRHNLSSDLIESVDHLIDRLEDIEKEIEISFKKEFQSFVSNNSQFFVYEITRRGDTKIAFKTGLDLLGHKPTALFHISTNGKHFYIQTTVPNEYQKFMSANEWLSQISRKLDSFELISKKRTHKMSSLKSNSMIQLKDAISCAENIAKIKFNTKSIE